MTRSISRHLLFSTLPLVFLATTLSAQTTFRKINDFDGDGRADFGITRTEGSYKIWYLWQTTAGFKRVHWGLSFDQAVGGDYDGDGRADIAVSRFVSSFPIIALDYYILASQTDSMIIRGVSSQGTDWAEFQQDYDGDGRTDPAMVLNEFRRIVYRSSSTNNLEVLALPPGFQSFGLRLGDMDGDNNAEIAYVDTTTNIVTWTNPVNGKSRSVQFGASGDWRQRGDFDGDGKGDLTIWRSSTGDWWWLRSSDNVVNVFHFGSSGDIPSPADYDGDGKTDHAVYRRGSPNSIYYIYGSQTGFQAFVWGVQTDVPVLY